jgi:hypothetical protein
MTSNEEFVLAIGSVLSETSTSKLQNLETRYVVKSLTSKPENWQVISHHISDPKLLGVVVKLTGNDYERMVRPNYADVTAEILQKIKDVPNLILVHEAVAGLRTFLPLAVDPDDYDDGSWNDRVAKEFFGEIPVATRAEVHALFDGFGITPTTYRRNSEVSALTASFIEDLQSNLLFRIYVPAGRMYEDELAKLLDMFLEWLGAVKSQPARQSGYRTPNGRVIEFHSESSKQSGSWQADLAEFSNFLGLVDDPAAATAILLGLGVQQRRAEELVSRYGRDARRVLLDSKHQKERLILAVQQQLEAELTDEGLLISATELEVVVRSLIPNSPFAASPTFEAITAGSRNDQSTPSVVINQQFINRVEGVVAQNVSGGMTVGTPMTDLIRLIQELGADHSEELEVAVHELEDPEAPVSLRRGALQKLQAFLIRNGERLESAAFATAWKLLEQKWLGHM